jgi:peptidoglycan hydrolase-like protein with peptidoglycan-binding domain
MASNGKLAPSELAPIPGGELAKPAAACWNKPGGPASAGCVPSGPRSSYRTYDEQVEFWNLYISGRGNLAARPGTSNHGWGLAVDLAAEWMRAWIDDHGGRFGWRKTEAWSEWWHVNYDGSVSCKEIPPFIALRKGDRGKRVRWYNRRLAFIHRPGGPVYLKRPTGRPGGKFKDDVEVAVRRLQRDHGLKVDGVIGEKTAHKISEVFHKQYIARKGKRKRRLGIAIRETAAQIRHGKPTNPHTDKETQ